jgi:hypothetical protein
MNICQTFLGIMVLSLMLTASPAVNALSSPPPDAPSVTNNLATNSPVSPVVIPADINPVSPLGQVIQMLQSGVDESVILAYINNSNVPFSLNSGDIIYLNDLGAPSDIVTAMIQHDQQLGVAINPQPSPPPQEIMPPPNQTAPPPDETESPPDESEPPPDLTESSFYGAFAPL